MKNLLLKKSLPLIIMAVLLVSMVLIAWFGVIPFHKFIVEKADEIQKFYTSRENRQRQLNELPALQEQFTAIEQDEKSLNVLLSENRIVDFVQTLEKLAAETNTSIVIESKEKGKIQEKKPVKAPAKKVTDPEKDAVATKTQATILESIPYDRYLDISVRVRGDYANIGVEMRLKAEEEEKNIPDNRNPFMLSPALGTFSSSETPETAVKQAPKGNVEAVFNTVVYVSKEE